MCYFNFCDYFTLDDHSLYGKNTIVALFTFYEKYIFFKTNYCSLDLIFFFVLLLYKLKLCEL